MRYALKFCCVVVPFFATAAIAQDPAPQAAQQAALTMKSPALSAADVDWAAVRSVIAGWDIPAAADQLAALNAATDTLFSKIAASTVPVLLPFDTGAFCATARMAP